MDSRAEKEILLLQQRIKQLQEQNAALKQQADDVARANVHAAGKLVEFIEGRAHDLEEKNRAIAEALSRAEHASMLKSRFLANMSHELRTPISGIIGMSELVRGSELTRQQRDQVDSIISTGESFLDLVNQLLDYSKAEADVIELEHLEYDLWQENESIAQMLHMQGQDKGIEVVLHLSPTLPRHVLGDRLRVRQVVLNLGANAVKFTSQGIVSIDVGTFLDDAGTEWIEWVVDDSGCGFDDNTDRCVFEPFVQADESTTRRFGGTGLGLTISRQLVKRMSGHITYASTVGRGTTFTVRIPLEAKPRTVCELGSPVVRLIAARASTMRTVSEQLPALGYRVVDDGNPSEQTDLTIFEASCDSAVAMERVRARYPDQPILLIESPGKSIDEAAFPALGVVGSLQQPIRPTQLVALLSEFEAQTANTRGTEPAPSFESIRALVVDDSPINLRVMGARLRGMGCEVAEATDGQEGYEAFAAGHFDVVFLDCHMPNVDGYEAAALMRQHERDHNTERVNIVALTADIAESNRKLCLASGMDEFCGKPMRAADAERILHQVRAAKT